MTLHILFAQRKCHYPGQYAPEALEIMTEYAIDDNPTYLPEKLEFYRKSEEFSNLMVIPVKVDDDKLDEILFQKNIGLEGTIHEEN